MPVELRKRAAPPPPPPPAKKKAVSKSKAEPAPKAKEPAPKVKESAPKVKETVPKVKEPAPKVKEPTPKAKDPALKVAEAPALEPEPALAAVRSSGGPPKVGDSIDLEGFGGEVETNDAKKTTLANLVSESKAGVVLFTYPKASTPGCTNQACLFRDSYEPLTATGLSIYGLSNDSPKANTTFKTKQKLPYPLLCDPASTLIGAIGFKKTPKGTTRGVFVVDKSGKVIVAQPGSPVGTVDAVKKLVADMGNETATAGAPETKESKDSAEAAGSAVTDGTSKI